MAHGTSFLPLVPSRTQVLQSPEMQTFWKCPSLGAAPQDHPAYSCVHPLLWGLRATPGDTLQELCQGSGWKKEEGGGDVRTSSCPELGLGGDG